MNAVTLSLDYIDENERRGLCKKTQKEQGNRPNTLLPWKCPKGSPQILSKKPKKAHEPHTYVNRSLYLTTY